MSPVKSEMRRGNEARIGRSSIHRPNASSSPTAITADVVAVVLSHHVGGGSGSAGGTGKSGARYAAVTTSRMPFTLKATAMSDSSGWRERYSTRNSRALPLGEALVDAGEILRRRPPRRSRRRSR